MLRIKSANQSISPIKRGKRAVWMTSKLLPSQNRMIILTGFSSYHFDLYHFKYFDEKLTSEKKNRLNSAGLFKTLYVNGSAYQFTSHTSHRRTLS